MICALCACALRGFVDGVMIERRVKREGRSSSGEKLYRIEKVLVCSDDDACGKRRIENERKREEK